MQLSLSLKNRSMPFPWSFSPLFFLDPGDDSNQPKSTPDVENEDNSSMTSFGVAVRGLPLALASMTQAATSDSRFHPKWRAITVATLLALVLILYLHLTVGDRDTPTRGYYRNRAHSLELYREGQDDIFRDANRQTGRSLAGRQKREKPYNDTYPLSPPEKTRKGIRYRIGVIADLDTASRSSKAQTWFSYMKRGYLTVSESADRLQVEWDAETITLESHLAEKGRGIWSCKWYVIYSGYMVMCSNQCASNLISFYYILILLQEWSCQSLWRLTGTCTLWMTVQVWCTGSRETRLFPGSY